jgi:hypothetical protein
MDFQQNAFPHKQLLKEKTGGNSIHIISQAARMLSENSIRNNRVLS